MGRVTQRWRVRRIREGEATDRPDTLAGEEPMEIRVDGRAVTVTMRTPGDDFDLAVGFLLTEGVVHDRSQVRAIRYCAGTDEAGRNTYNVVDLTLEPGVVLPELTLERAFYTTSSCGVCGKGSIEALRLRTSHPVAGDPLRVGTSVLARLPERMRSEQATFERTGGLHAAGLFDADGDLVCLREDVGRHNAFDKVIGWAGREGRIPLRGHVLLASGRASFELVQKALMAGAPLLAAVSAPSSLAAELAQESGMTLVGFLRGESMNVYTHPHRVVLSGPRGAEAGTDPGTGRPGGEG